MCGDGEYDVLAALFFTPPEESVKSLFHDQQGKHVMVKYVIRFVAKGWCNAFVIGRIHVFDNSVLFKRLIN